MSEALLDSDIVSLFFKGHPRVVENTRTYLLARTRPFLRISILSYFEILRGLEELVSRRRISEFDRWIGLNRVIPLDVEIVRIAAELYARTRRVGRPIADADLLIAATAIRHHWELVTNNERHFKPIPGLVVVNWTKGQPGTSP